MAQSPEDYCLQRSDFRFKNQRAVYHGKVRDVYDLGDQLIIITTDRISAFDHILPPPVPYKGQVLNQMAVYALESVRDICPVWLHSSPDPVVSIGVHCVPVPVEMVVRGYLAGHAWRQYRNGIRQLCGVTLPDGLKEGDPFPEPIITPTTKASEGHDADISREELLNQRIVDRNILDAMYDYAYALYHRGARMAAAQGLILVDTKYEFGTHGDDVMLMDEIHTPDSSRYYIADGYQLRQEEGKSQIQLSKEFVREWLMEHGFQGKDHELMPQMPDSFVWEVSRRYVELYEKITGRAFEKPPVHSVEDRVLKNLAAYF